MHMRNELLIRKHIKNITKKGVSKAMAIEIAESAYDMNNGKDIEKYINYALNLTHGLEFARV